MGNLKQEFKGLSKELRAVFLILFIIAIGSLSGTAVLALKLRHASDPALAAKEEVERLVIEIGRLIVLPTDEIPTFATVSEPEKLRDQAFFSQAEVGDKVLLYATSRKAILWRPSTKQIIEVSNLNVDSPESSN